jgi:hypothetical protein
MTGKVQVYAVEYCGGEAVRRWKTGEVTVKTSTYNKDDPTSIVTYTWETPGVGKFKVEDATYVTSIYIPQLNKAIEIDNEAGVPNKQMSISMRNRIITEILHSAESSIDWQDFLKASFDNDED